MEWWENAIIYSSYIAYVLYIIIAIGVWKEAPHYLSLVNWGWRVAVGLVLLYVFNPFRKTIYCTRFHQKIIFSSALFLLTPIINFPTFFQKNWKDLVDTLRK